MDNIEMKVEGNNLIITIDITKEGELSKSGKNLLVATTRGNVSIEGTDLKMGLNVYKSAPK